MDLPRPILVVDDDPDLRGTLSDALRFEGFVVNAVQHGQEALEWLRDRPTARPVILLDLMMPVLDGKAFLEKRLGDPALSELPVIVLTAGGDCAELRIALNIARCLPKTVTLSELVSAIVSVMR